MGLQYTRLQNKHVKSGTNVNGSSTTIPANRVVGHSTSTVHDHPIDLLSVTGATKIAGVTSHAIEAGKTGDVHSEGVVPVESDGSGTIAAGQDLTVDTATGRVKVAAPAAGANAYLVGKAQSAAAATAGAIVMVELNFSVMQGA